MQKYLLKLLMFLALSLSGCQEIFKGREKGISIDQFNSIQSIRDYLSANVASVGFGGKPYCAYEVLDAHQKSEKLYLYLWSVCQEYYTENKKLRQGTGSVFPVALIAQTTGGHLRVLEHRLPRESALYVEDMLVIFSKVFRAKNQAETTTEKNERVNKLQAEIERAVEMESVESK